jgi:S-DNA-T family DNA segregation ATPase FtsK/SpoIIIE
VPNRAVVIGATTLVLNLTSAFEKAEEGILERGGGLHFNRSPRVDVRYPGIAHPPPRMPTEQAGRVFPWTILVAPVIMALAIYAITGRERALLLIFMTPLMAMGNFMNQRTQTSNKKKYEVELFERQFEKLEETLFRSKPEEEGARNDEVPPVAEVFEHSVRLGPLLWTRRPEHWNFLALRLGTTRAPSRNSIAEQDTQDGLPEYIERLDRLRDRYRYVDDVPILESLRAVGSVGVAGPAGPASDALRGLALQLFGLHAPNEVVAVAIAGNDWMSELEWMKWLPHTTSETSPFKDLPLADSPPTANALLSALEEYVLRAGESPEPRGPFAEKWNPMQYGTDVHRAGEEGATRQRVSVIVIVTDDAPVDRPR